MAKFNDDKKRNDYRVFRNANTATYSKEDNPEKNPFYQKDKVHTFFLNVSTLQEGFLDSHIFLYNFLKFNVVTLALAT